MPYNCEPKEQPAQPTLAIRTRTSVQALPQTLGRAYGVIAQYLVELREPPSGAPYAAYHNMDMQNMDVEIGFPVAHALPGKGEIQPSEIPGGKVVTCLHIGPYSEVKPAYDALTGWMQAHGHQPAGVAYEMYLNDSANTPPEELQTLIVFPLKS